MLRGDVYNSYKLFNSQQKNLSLLGIIILDCRQDFEPKKFREKIFDNICYVKVGSTDLAVKVGCIFKPVGPQQNS